MIMATPNEHSSAHVPTIRPPEDWEAHTNPDWPGIFHRMDADTGTAVDGLDTADMERLNAALREILKWCLATPHNSKFERITGRRLIALAWAVDPSLIEGSPSLRQLAASMGLVGATLLARQTVAVRKRFGLTPNGAQRAHDWRLKQ